MNISKIVVVIVLTCFITCGCEKITPESYHEESTPIEADNNFIQDLSIDETKILNGEWQIDRAVLQSNMYTGTSLDGDFENNIFDSEDYVGYILRYSEDSFSLGDVEYANPCYSVSEITVKEYNEGGGFRNPDLYTLIAEEEIDVEGNADTPDLYQARLIRVDVTFDYETDYLDYSFIPVGTQVVLLDHNTMLVGVWGKIMLAYRIQRGIEDDVQPPNSTFDLDETIKMEEYLETSVPELTSYKQFIEEQSSGEAHLIVEMNFTLLKIGEKNFYPIYVGEQWDDHRVNWEWFYVSEQMDEILWYNLADDEFYSLEEWRNSKEYR